MRYSARVLTPQIEYLLVERTAEGRLTPMAADLALDAANADAEGC
jgi:hypothetical protein